MSVIERLQELSGESNGPYEALDFSGTGEMAHAGEMMQSVPIPGQSLTNPMDQKNPWEQPPEFTDLQEYVDHLFLKLSDPEKLEQLLDVMSTGVPLEHIAQKFLMKSFKDGEITPDMLLMAIEPAIYILIALATYGGVSPVLYPEEDMMDPADDEPKENVFKRASRELLASEDKDQDGRITVQEVQAPAVQPKSLLARSKQAAQKVKTKGAM